jgi:hypothetical protein
VPTSRGANETDGADTLVIDVTAAVPVAFTDTISLGAAVVDLRRVRNVRTGEPDADRQRRSARNS